MLSNLFSNCSSTKYISSINSIDTLVFFYLNIKKGFGLALFKVSSVMLASLISLRHVME